MIKGPNSRLVPSQVSAQEKCILDAGNKSDASQEEVYELTNLFAWENVFGIRH